jgi:ribokinase
MEVLNFGSMNLDNIYHLDHFVAEGETIAATSLNFTIGGKGLNQSIALSRSGLKVYHAGLIGKDGEPLKDYLENNRVDTRYIEACCEQQGHAAIQIEKGGKNSIIIYGGSNRAISTGYIDRVLDNFTADSYLILQNEISNVEYVIDSAYKKGIKVIFNASPIDGTLLKIDYNKVAWLIINEVEGAQITGRTAADDILSILESTYPRLGIVLTLGESGSVCSLQGIRRKQSIFHVHTVDTTAAGDTFLGYFVSGVINDYPIEKALELASAASSLTVTKNGAADSIPTIEEVKRFLDHISESI